MLLTLMLPMDTTMASVKLRLTLLSSTLAMLDTLMLPPMELTPTPSPPPPLDLSTLPTLVFVLTTLELPSLARQHNTVQYSAFIQHHASNTV